MRRYSYLVLVLLLFLLLGQAGAQREGKQPVYVGARVCGQCHDGKGMGHQFSTWMTMKHSYAYAALWSPEAKAMAELSGIPVEPVKSTVCLGCHSTGGETDAWERDPTFRVEDGVQCERCHGPGSEYANEQTMRNKEAARRAGLRMPTKHDCAMCHYVKGSHVAIHKRPALNIDEAWKTISHPLPQPSVLPGGRVRPAAPPDATRPKYTGSMVCSKCHSSKEMGYGALRWRISRHAQAWAVLGTEKGWDYAKKHGVNGDPQRSADCLKCHTTGYANPAGGYEETYAVEDGVTCEACHGAGSRYAAEAIMRDPRAARQAGLLMPTRETCLKCHTDSKENPFDYGKKLALIAHPLKPVSPEKPAYKTPVNVTVRPGGAELYVACEASGSVIVVDAVQRRKVAEIVVGGEAADVTFSPDGKTAYASNRLTDVVSVIDTAARKVIREVKVGGEPHGLLTDASGRTLYVLNTMSGDISVIDTATLTETKRLSASRAPWSLARSPDGSRIIATNMLSRFVPFRSPSLSEITVIDATRSMVEDRVRVPGANLMLGAAWHPTGEFAFLTLNRTKNMVPMTRILQGWTITNGLGVLWKNGKLDEILLDEPNLSFPDAADVDFTPDGKYALVTSASSDRVAVVDVWKLITMLRHATPDERQNVIPNHLGKSSEFVAKIIATKNSPRGVTVAPDGSAAYVVNALDDSLTVIDLHRMAAVDRIDLGGAKVISKARYGERLFNSANITFQRQFSCHSCHPDGHVDGLTYDIEADGIGVSPVDNRTLRGITDTDPFKWEGTNPTLARQCGPRLAVFFTRLSPFNPEQLDAVDYYIKTIPRPPNRFRPLGADYTEAQRRGRLLFYRTRTNDGREIPPDGRCVTCHFPPMYTDRALHDVDTKYTYDRAGKFDVPHLNNIHDSAPYLHNGMAETLEEIWTRFNPNDRHGVTNDMTKDQLNDLIEFLKTL